MPNTKSAKKRLRQSKVRRSRNRSVKSAVRTQIKKVGAAIESADAENAEKEYAHAAKKLDQAGSKGVMHKNTAARYKSRMQKKIKAIKSS